MYLRILRGIENLFVFIVKYIVPLAVVIILILGYFKIFSPREIQETLARWGWWLLVFLLFIKPISIITKRRFQAIYRKLPEGINYLFRGWTQEPILIYSKHLLINTIYSLSLYFMRRRKQLGILTFWTVLIHRICLEIIRYQQGAQFLFMGNNLLVWVGIIGVIALFVGFVTSNMTSIKLLKHRRKAVQRIAYLAFLGACIHLFFFSHQRIYIVVFAVFLFLKIWERIPVTTTPIEEKKSVPVQGVPDMISARVINHRHLTDDVLEFNVDVHQELKVIPGQWALFSREDKEGKFNRAYSIVDSDVDEGSTLLTFAVKVTDGRGTTLLENIKIGDILQIKGIYGHFILQDTDKPKVFIGTGTGLSPLINMASHCTVKDKTLLYSVSYHKDVFYEDRIKKIPDLSYEIHITKEEVSGYTFGRLDLKQFTFSQDTEFYICGNPHIVDEISQELSGLGYKNIFCEKY